MRLVEKQNRLNTGADHVQEIAYAFWCPGRKEPHHYITWSEMRPGFIPWSFNGNEQCPSFTPSLKRTTPWRDNSCCHMFVTDGMIQYCGDCKHELAGKTVPMVDLDSGGDVWV
jgi:hypothetical protein